MPLIYRSMTRDGDRPKDGPTARMLGVRVPADLPERGGMISPGTGGMSVAPGWRDLPPWRIPRRLAGLMPDAAGKSEDACWRMGEGPFREGDVAEGLRLRPDEQTHGLVEPAPTMGLASFQAHLADTIDHWRIDED